MTGAVDDSETNAELGDSFSIIACVIYCAVLPLCTLCKNGFGCLNGIRASAK